MKGFKVINVIVLQSDQYGSNVKKSMGKCCKVINVKVLQSDQYRSVVN